MKPGFSIFLPAALSAALVGRVHAATGGKTIAFAIAAIKANAD